MNYKVGFKRIYVVAVGCWIIGWCWFMYVVSTPEETRSDRLFGVALALLPPILGYIIFFVIVPWVIKGFKHKG